MLRSYLVTTLRRLRRDAGYAAVNLVGLTVGLAACLLIGLYVRHELSYDTFHPEGDRAYRVVQYVTGFDGDTNWRAGTSGLLAPRLRDDWPGVETATRLWTRGPTLVEHDGRATTGLTSFAAEPSFFDLFGFRLTAGAATGLARPNTVVLTRALAARLFADEGDAVGQTLTTDLLGETTTLEVVGVMAGPPANTHLGGFDLLLSFASLETEGVRLAVDNAQFATYARLTPEAAPEAVADALAAQIAAIHAGGARVEALRMQPLADVYFGDLRAPKQGDAQYVALFGAIAGVILLIACFNYMNLATARTTQRGRETGVRKALGAHYGAIVAQCLSEAVVLSLLALPCALGLAMLLLPSLSALTGADLTLAWAGDGPLLLALVAATLGVGLLAGSYPALVLSRYRPLQVLRGQLETGARGRRVRQALVVTQFALTAALLFATGMVLRQLDFLQTRDLGFEDEEVVAFELVDQAARARAGALRQAFAGTPGVRHASLSAGLPGAEAGFFGRVASSIERGDGRVTLHHGYVDTTYAETLGLRLVAGRFLRPGDAPADPEARATNEPVVLNEAAAEALGWHPARTAVGETLSYFEGEKPIVGVVADFHYRSLHHRIDPLALHYVPRYADRVLAVRLAPGAGRRALDRLEAAWADVTPHLPFEPRFLDADLDAQYRAEARAARLVTAFAAVAVVLACLGLVGLATYAAARRRKEISIRKVLGASAAQIVALLGRQFAALVLGALVLGAPVALYGVTRWLEGFAYHAPLSPVPFAWAGGLVLAVALLSVGVQTLRAARTDPARTLRAE